MFDLLFAHTQDGLLPFFSLTTPLAFPNGQQTTCHLKKSLTNLLVYFWTISSPVGPIKAVWGCTFDCALYRL